MPQAASNNRANSVLVFHLHKLVKVKNVFIALFCWLWFDGDFAESFEERGRYFVCVTHGGADVFVAHRLLHSACSSSAWCISELQTHFRTIHKLF